MTEGQVWDVATYESRFKFVSEYGASLIDLLDPRPGERILDLGCGTGHLTRQIADRGAQTVGLDRSPPMIEEARSAYPDLEFVVRDGADLRFDTPFDAVFSNAALHWMTDPRGVVESVRRALKPDGRFVAEMGGAGNIQSIRDAIAAAAEQQGLDLPPASAVWYFPGAVEYASLLEEHGFRVSFMTHFDRPTVLAGEDGMAHFLHMFGSTFFEAIPAADHPVFVRAIEDRLRPSAYQDGNWVADYVRLRFVALRSRD